MIWKAKNKHIHSRTPQKDARKHSRTRTQQKQKSSLSLDFEEKNNMYVGGFTPDYRFMRFATLHILDDCSIFILFRLFLPVHNRIAHRLTSF